MALAQTSPASLPDAGSYIVSFLAVMSILASGVFSILAIVANSRASAQQKLIDNLIDRDKNRDENDQKREKTIADMQGTINTLTSDNRKLRDDFEKSQREREEEKEKAAEEMQQLSSALEEEKRKSADQVKAHDKAMNDLRTEMNDTQEKALNELRTTLERTHGEAMEALKASLGKQHQEAMTELKTSLEAAHEQAMNDIKQEHNGEMSALQTEVDRLTRRIADFEATRDALNSTNETTPTMEEKPDA